MESVKSETILKPVWEDIECAKCPEPFDEDSWNRRHSKGFDELHGDCCNGCDLDEDGCE